MTDLILKGMTIEQLENIMNTWKQPKFRAKQLAEWMYGKNVVSFSEMTNLSVELRNKLQETAAISLIQLVAREVSSDVHTVKYLFSLIDQHAIESVLMKHDYGCTVCVSSQVGCPMKCAFCASTMNGFVRNLTTGEMIEQIVFINRELAAEAKRVSNIVIMGSGEPLLNYDQVLEFIHLAHLPIGPNIGFRHITLSTCGIVPQIKQLADEGIPITLAISLHAPTDQLRSKLMPVNLQYPLKILMEACDYFILKTGRRITFEYLLIANVNDNETCAQALSKLLKNKLCNVNLIPANEVTELAIARPTMERVDKFKDVLYKNGIEVTVRREMGNDISAACGQLRRKYMQGAD